MALKNMVAPGPLLGTHQALPPEGSMPSGNQRFQGRQGNAGVFRVYTGRFLGRSEGG